MRTFEDAHGRGRFGSDDSAFACSYLERVVGVDSFRTLVRIRPVRAPASIRVARARAALALGIVVQEGQAAVGLDATVKTGSAPCVTGRTSGLHAQQQRILVAIGAHFDERQAIARRFALAPQRGA